MRQIRQVLRLSSLGKSQREIARSLLISRQTVADYLKRSKAAGLSWSEAESMEEDELVVKLFPVENSNDRNKYPDPDWTKISEELDKKGATLMTLHCEYLIDNPTGMSYSTFCDRFKKFKRFQKIYMRQSYLPGDVVFVDYSGKTLPITNKETGEEQEAQVFVAVLGYSSVVYVEVHWTQSLANWIAATIRMLRFFGGAPRTIVCDNLKAAVTKADRNNPIINYTYFEMAEHYGIDITPARPYKPKDKAKAENGVLHVQRQILFVLRNEKLQSLGEANEKIKELTEKINNKPFSKMDGSRWQRFRDVERDALLSLPAEDYQFAEYRKVRVGRDYHVEFEKNSYSVPYKLANQVVELRVTVNTIEILNKGKRVASHARSYSPCVKTESSHMPSNHLAIKDFNSAKELSDFLKQGIHIHNFVKKSISKLRNKQREYRLCNAIKSLGNEYGHETLNNACECANKLSITTISRLTHILRHELYNKPDSHEGENNINHTNIRGSDYYR